MSRFVRKFAMADGSVQEIDTTGTPIGQPKTEEPERPTLPFPEDEEDGVE